MLTTTVRAAVRFRTVELAVYFGPTKINKGCWAKSQHGIEEENELECFSLWLGLDVEQPHASACKCCTSNYDEQSWSREVLSQGF